MSNNARKELTADEAVKVAGGENSPFRPPATVRTESFCKSINCSGCGMPCVVTVTTTFFENETQKTSVQTQGGGDCCPNCGCVIPATYNEANDPSSGSQFL